MLFILQVVWDPSLLGGAKPPQTICAYHSIRFVNPLKCRAHILCNFFRGVCPGWADLRDWLLSPNKTLPLVKQKLFGMIEEGGCCLSSSASLYQQSTLPLQCISLPPNKNKEKDFTENYDYLIFHGPPCRLIKEEDWMTHHRWHLMMEELRGVEFGG